MFKWVFLLSLILISTILFSIRDLINKDLNVEIILMSHPSEDLWASYRICKYPKIDWTINFCKTLILGESQGYKNINGCLNNEKICKEYTRLCDSSDCLTSDFFKKAEQIKKSQDLVSESIKKFSADLVIYESDPPESFHVKNSLNECRREFGSDCIYRYPKFIYNGEYKDKNTVFLLNESDISIIINDTNFNLNIPEMKEKYMKAHAQAILKLVKNSKYKKIQIIVGSEHRNYVSCKILGIEKPNCNEIDLSVL